MGAPSFKIHEASSFEYDGSSHNDGRDQYLQKKVRAVRKLDSLRIGITILALCCGLATLGLSGYALSVYNMTYLPADYFLALWPAALDTKPSVTLVVGSAVLTVVNLVAVVCGKVTKVRANTRVHTPIMFLAPLLGFIAALVAMSVFFAVNASETEDTILSWSCRWQDVPVTTAPHFASLCKQGWASVAMAVALVPLEFVALIVAGVQYRVEKGMLAYNGGRKGSA